MMLSPLISTRSSKALRFRPLARCGTPVDAVRFSGQRDVVAHCGNLRVGGILFEIPHRDGHALGDLHQPIGQSRHFFLSQNALGHTLGALLFCGKLLIIILLLFILWQSPDKR